MDEKKIVNHANYLYPYILRDLDSGFSGLIFSSKHKSKVLTLFSESASGLQITAGQRTMSGQNWVLTGQILGLPDILSGPLPTRSKKF